MVSIEKANGLLDHFKKDLGLKGEYRFQAEEKVSGIAKPDVLTLMTPYFIADFDHRIIIDKKEIQISTKREITATILHELGHIKDLNVPINILIMMTIFSPIYMRTQPLIGSLFELILLPFVIVVPIFFFIVLPIHRQFEYKADNWAKKYGFGDEMIILLERYIGKSTASGPMKILLKLSHPSIHNRINRLKGR